MWDVSRNYVGTAATGCPPREARPAFRKKQGHSNALCPSEFPLVYLHIHLAPAEADTFGFESKPLFHGRASGELDRSARTQYPLPGQSKTAPQHRGHLPCRARKARGPSDRPVGRNFPAWNRADPPLDSQTPDSRLILISLSGLSRG